MSFGFGFSIVATRGLSLAQRAIALLRSLGTSAHVWLPGANGVSVASLPSNNYLLSDGSTGYSTVDGVDGLDLDGMGSLGSELVTNGDFSAGTTGWTAVNSPTLSISASGVAIQNAGATNGLIYQAKPTVAGKTYKISGTIVYGGVGVARVEPSNVIPTTVGGGYISVTASGSYECFFVATATTTHIVVGNRNDSNATHTYDNISVKEYTGTHLTQATTANKPLVRRGMLNELLNSATPATQSVTCIAAPYTLALYGTGNVVLSGTGAGTLTGTGASDLVVLNFTPTAGSVTFTKAGTVSSFGLFKGTWTAAQILAEGGIPTTTATAASSPSAGKYWWSFDGSNDSLLSGNLGITNACTIVIAGRVNSLAAINYLFAEAVNGFGLYVNTDGSVVLTKIAASNLAIAPAATITAGVPFVLTARLSAGTAAIRNLGVQKATAATAETFSATTGAMLGATLAGTLPTNGAIGWVVPLPVALSDADCLTVERLVGQQFPGMSTVDGDANSMLLEDGSGFLTMETGDLLLLE